MNIPRLKYRLKKNYSHVVVLSLIIVALMMKIPLFIHEFGFFSVSFIQSIIYIGIFIAWSIWVKRRVVFENMRNRLFTISKLIIFWMIIRTVRYMDLTRSVYINRHIFYIYYIPVIFITLQSFYISMSIGKPSDYRLPKWTRILNIIGVFVIFMFLTNDFHNILFIFPSERIKLTENYKYGVLYWIIAGLIYTLIILTQINLIRKSRVINNKKGRLLALLPGVLLVVYNLVKNLLRTFMPGLIYVLNLDFTVVSCLIVIITFEICFYTGLINSNTNYKSIFEDISMPIFIINRFDNCVYSETYAARDFDLNEIENFLEKDSENEIYENSYRIKKYEILNGEVIWVEDVSELIDIIYKLLEVKNELEDYNTVLLEEYRSNLKIQRLKEDNRIINLMQDQTKKQIDIVKERLEMFKNTDDIKEKKKILSQLVVLGTYLKRRNNLLFISEQNKMVSIDELEFSFRETVNNLNFINVESALFIKDKGNNAVHIQDIMKIYDFFEKIIETCVNDLDSVYIILNNGEKPSVRFEIVTGEDLSFLKDRNIEVKREDENSWVITNTIEG